jgi:hypothetical protein
LSDVLRSRLIVAFDLHRRSRVRVLQWVKKEWHDYADPKFDESREEHDANMRTEGCGPDTWWYNQTLQYMVRANILGLDTLAGKQLMLKGLATYIDMCASVQRVYGNPPKAGYPSGEIHEDRSVAQLEE